MGTHVYPGAMEHGNGPWKRGFPIQNLQCEYVPPLIPGACPHCIPRFHSTVFRLCPIFVGDSSPSGVAHPRHALVEVVSIFSHLDLQLCRIGSCKIMGRCQVVDDVELRNDPWWKCGCHQKNGMLMGFMNWNFMELNEICEWMTRL